MHAIPSSPIMAQLARNHTVIVPDLRGAGASEKTGGGYDKKNMAKDIHELVAGIATEPAVVVGHDIGLMVSYAYAAQYPQDVKRLALLEAFLGSGRSGWWLTTSTARSSPAPAIGCWTSSRSSRSRPPGCCWTLSSSGI